MDIKRPSKELQLNNIEGKLGKIKKEVKESKLFWVYIAWLIIVLCILAFQGVTRDNITRTMILGFILIQIIFLPLLLNYTKRFEPRKTFLIFGVALAAIVEGTYMVSNPVFSILIINSTTSLQGIIINYLIDLIFTLPVYFGVFLFIWFLINKYKYGFFEYLFFMGLGQTIGDGGFYLISAPLMIAFLPYIMTNYHAMNVLPFFLVKEKISAKKTSKMKYLLPIIVIPIIYIVSGFLIKIIGGFFGLK